MYIMCSHEYPVISDCQRQNRAHGLQDLLAGQDSNKSQLHVSCLFLLTTCTAIVGACLNPGPTPISHVCVHTRYNGSNKFSWLEIFVTAKLTTKLAPYHTVAS